MTRLLLFSAVSAAMLSLCVESAGAADLDQIHDHLMPLRDRAPDSRNAPQPGFLAARDGARDWIEAQLATLTPAEDVAAFEEKLNAAIVAADLACIEGKAPGYDRCAGPRGTDARGYLGPIEVERVRDLLLIERAVGAVCGFDETTALYTWNGTRWSRVIDMAQSAEDGIYTPEQIEQVFFTGLPGKPSSERLIATTSVRASCDAGWRPAHYQLWHVDADGAATALIEGREADVYIGRRGPAVSARLDHQTFLVEMDVASLDSTRQSRVAVRKFQIDNDGDGVTRVAPVALTPRDFVEEWLLAPWNSAAAWSAPSARASLQKTHAVAHAAQMNGRFRGPTQRCADESLQVSVMLNTGAYSFRVTQDGDTFQMQTAAPTPDSACATPEPGRDSRRTLFP